MIHVDIDRTWKILKCLERDDVKLRQASRYYGIPAKILKGRQKSGDLATKKLDSASLYSKVRPT